ncbi:MAG: type 12 methyltransferase [Candidatus Rokubacteria bacterium CSP1-6]|nr:MAG: type 12 methyltransferase [Candidatus Rokubacteria bacterium CSP1-6]
MSAWVCLLCECATPTDHLYTFGARTVERCRRCGLEFLHPQPGPAELGALYDARYFASSASAAHGYERYEADEPNLRKTFRRRLRRLSTRISPSAPRRLLDVGCALGYSLAVAAESGWDAAGVEMSAWAAAEARRRFGLDVRRGSLSSVDFPPATFDLITLWDVLEHLADPREALRRCHELLKPNGHLALTTPNTAGLLRRVTGRRWVEYKIPEHLYFFDPTTIHTLLEKSGFHPLSIRSEGKYVGVAFLLKRLAEANPLLAPLRALATLPRLRRLSLYVNATNTMLVVARKA